MGERNLTYSDFASCVRVNRFPGERATSAFTSQSELSSSLVRANEISSPKSWMNRYLMRQVGWSWLLHQEVPCIPDDHFPLTSSMEVLLPSVPHACHESQRRPASTKERMSLA